MKKMFLIIMLVAFLPAEQIYKQIRVYGDLSIFSKLQISGIDIDHSNQKYNEWIEFAIIEDKINIIDELNLKYEIIHHDLEQFYLSRLDNNYQSRDFDLGSMGGYYTFEEIEEHLDDLFVNYPQLITEKISLGQSLEGRDIWMVKISDNPNIDESEPEVLYTGLHHAREPMSYMNLFYFMYWLCENYNNDSEATALINNRELYFIPAINPDGLIYNQQISPNGGGMQRKNRLETCNNGTDGVDLNRNYSFMWAYDNEGSSSDGCNETYRGNSPFSEPETFIIKEFVEQHDFVIALNYHSYGNLLIHPYGFNPGLPVPDEDLDIFEEYGQLMTQYNQYLVGTGIETVGYTVNGEACDWMYGEQGIYAYTPEIGSWDDGFWPATNRIIPLAEENLFPNKFVAWASGSIYDIDFSIEEGPYLPSVAYSSNLILKNNGLGNSNGDVTITLDSPDNLIIFEESSFQIGEVQARSEINFGDLINFQISPTALGGTRTQLHLTISDEDNYNNLIIIDLIIGNPIVIEYFNFEESLGWYVDEENDNATSGIWEIGLPVATFSGQGNQGQAGMDHSEVGEQCFLTGASTQNNNVGFDDVDGGKTTLLSPVFDFSEYSEVLITYWRWYTNNAGNNPNTDHWKVEVTSNFGETWIELENTSFSAVEWIEKTYYLSTVGLDFTDQVQFRFIAEDIYNEGDNGSGASAVEAAIDDFSISIFNSNSYMLGDINLDELLNILDVVLLVSYILGEATLTSQQEILSDINLDNLSDILDVILLLTNILDTY